MTQKEEIERLSWVIKEGNIFINYLIDLRRYELAERAGGIVDDLLKIKKYLEKLQS